MVTITSMRTAEEAAAFHRLNEAWIRAYFTVEQKDTDTILDPWGHYVDPGGDVLIARDEDGTIIGCIALEPSGDGAFELSKMAVDPAAQGRGAGRTLIEAALERARELGGTSVWLGSNSVLAPAVHLYEATGFEHVPRESIGDLPYVRANVFMALRLDQPDVARR